MMFHTTFHPTEHCGDLLPALDPSSVPRELRHVTTIKGAFNGEPFCLTGGGKGRPHDGVLDVRLVSERGQVNFPMPIMNVIAIFGYPTYSRHVNVFDIFKRSNGYEYERNIEFETGGSMHSIHLVRYGDMDRQRFITGTFEVTGSGVLPPDILALDPIVETFVPSGPGVVRSKFMLSWRRHNGSRFLASCESEYRLRHQLELPQVLYRCAEFVKDRSTRDILDLDERISVSDGLANAEMLAA